MKDSSSPPCSEESTAKHAEYELLKQALTPQIFESGQDSEQMKAKDMGKKSIRIAVVRLQTYHARRSLINDSQAHMMHIRRNRMTIVKLDTTMPDEFTGEGKMEIAKFYQEHPPPHNIKKLNRSMCLLLVRFTQSWSDEEFMAALNNGEIFRCTIKSILSSRPDNSKDSKDEENPSTLPERSTKGKEKCTGL